jgi:hypothetical protein
MVHVVNKGKEGEREVVKILTPIVQRVMRDMDYPEDEIIAAAGHIQRNQNQSAVGGCDLSNTFGIAFEVKRQEQLSVNTWWEQCCRAATRIEDLPVLIYRQNRKPWRIRTYGFLPVPAFKGDGGHWSDHRAVVEFDLPTFELWFSRWVRGKLEAGYKVTG